jgi:hypothetical protein
LTLRAERRDFIASLATDPETRVKPSGRAGLVLPALILLVALACVYGPALTSGFVNYDDTTQIVRNPLVTSPSRVPLEDLLLTRSRGYVVPVTLLAQALLWQLGGGEPWVFHAFSLLVHAALSLALLVVLARVVERPLAFVGALIFALHPACVEPVLWATGLKDLLATSLGFAATVAFVRLASAEHPTRARAALVIVAATASMLSKPTAVLLASAWLAYLASRRTGPRSASDDGRLAWRVAWVVLGVGLGLGALSRVTHDTLLVHHPLDWKWPLPWSVLGRQALHVVFPVALHPGYAIDSARVDGYTILGMGIAVALVAGVFRLRHAPLPLLGFTAALATYFPVSNVLPFARQMSDSYLYAPLVGLVVCGALLLESVTSQGVRKGVLIAGGLAVVQLGVLSHRQTRRWHDSVSLWSPAVAAMPTFDTALGGLAAARAVDGDIDAAASLYERAFAVSYREELVSDFGVVLAQAGRFDDAECVLVESALTGRSPLAALRNYAVLFAHVPGRRPRYPEAERYLLPSAIYAGRNAQIDLDPQTLRRLEALWNASALTATAVPPPWSRAQCPILAGKGHLSR